MARQLLHAQLHQRQRFDDTVPVADGYMEIGTNVPLDQLREAMQDWFRRKSYLPPDSKLSLSET